MRALAMQQLTPRSDAFGYLGGIVIDGGNIYAVGGTHNQPTLLVSTDRGLTFQAWKTPTLERYGKMPGLRDVHIEGEQVWVVGEWGGVAVTSDRGETWRELRPANLECLYWITRGHDRRLWILGDGGLVLRSRRGKASEKFDPVENQSKERMLYMFLDGKSTWLLDSGGNLQRNTGRGFEIVPLKAMRTPRPLCALVRTPKKTLILLGDGGLVLRSTNDGESWKKISVASRNDLEKLLVTPYGIFVVGQKGSLLVSHDDGVSFQGLDTNTSAHLWALAIFEGEILISGEAGQIWRIPRTELGQLLHDVYEKRDPILAGLAARVRDGDEGAELVLDDALKEREMI